MSDPSAPSSIATTAEPAPADWFREPTVREHRIAAGLFFGFAVFFTLLFIVQAGWWFRWVVLGLAAWSLFCSLGHARDAWRGGDTVTRDPSRDAEGPAR